MKFINEMYDILKYKINVYKELSISKYLLRVKYVFLEMNVMTALNYQNFQFPPTTSKLNLI